MTLIKFEIPGPELDRKLNAFIFSGQFNKKIEFPLYIAPGRAEYRNPKQIPNDKIPMTETKHRYVTRPYRLV